MAECRAIRTGFSTAFRRPAVFAAELAWRWAFSFAAWLLIAYGILLFLRSVPVSDADMFGLSGIIPGRIVPTILHILAGSGPKLLRVVLALLLGLTVLSWMAQSIGHTAVLRSLLSHANGARGLISINMLRSFGALLVALGYAGCAFLILRSSTPQERGGPGSLAADDSLLFTALACVLAWLWARIDTRLTLAAVISLRSGESALTALLAAADLSMRRVKQFAWIGLVFGAIRFGLLIGALFGALMVFSMFVAVSSGLALIAVLAVTMVYSALVNFFKVGALAAQVRVIEWDADL